MNHILDLTKLIDSFSIHCKESLEGTEFRCRHLHCKYLHSSKWFLHLVMQSIRSSQYLLKHLLQVLWSCFFFCLYHKSESGKLRVISAPEDSLFLWPQDADKSSVYTYIPHTTIVCHSYVFTFTLNFLIYIFSRLKNPSEDYSTDPSCSLALFMLLPFSELFLVLI